MVTEQATANYAALDVGADETISMDLRYVHSTVEQRPLIHR